MGSTGPAVTASAAAHAERIRARAEERAAAAEERDGRQTSEIYGARAAAGFRADEALREQARLNDARARGEWTPGDTEEEDVEAEAEEYEEEPAEDDDEGEHLSTAERYARRERARQAAEHQANVRAQGGAVRTMV
ncbi:hypothetical protein ACFV06_31445 [Streptomyces sp. NPDC059618]|uniref:hypothetical protein n=1 Tax=Streptomyces sp. NPDC059618 TaxID=3346887 RepID=UPI0036AB3A68